MKRFSSDSTHWYTSAGQPMHTVIGANGKARSATLADARKEALLPSVTNILGVVNKPALTEWKMQQAVLSALTLPRLDGEGTDAFADRVVADALEYTGAAAEFGTKMHEACELVLTSQLAGWEREVEAWLPYLLLWVGARVKTVHWVEQQVVSVGGGYAGTADALVVDNDGRVLLVDFKTQGIKPGKVAVFYPEWCAQIAAYAAALRFGWPDLGCCNVVIDSRNPGVFVERIWTGDEVRAGEAAFRAAATLWRWQKGYDPRGPGWADGGILNHEP